MVYRVLKEKNTTHRTKNDWNSIMIMAIVSSIVI